MMDDYQTLVQKISALRGMFAPILGLFLLYPRLLFAEPERQSLSVQLVQRTVPQEWEIIQLPFAEERGTKLIRADIEGDDKDVVLLVTPVENRLDIFGFQNTALGKLSEIALPESISKQTLGAGDIDGDGRDELVWFSAATSTIHYARLASRQKGALVEISIPLPSAMYTFDPSFPNWRCQENAPSGIVIKKSLPNQPSTDASQYTYICVPPGNFSAEILESSPHIPRYQSLVPLAPIRRNNPLRQDLLTLDYSSGLFYIRHANSNVAEIPKLWADFSPYLSFPSWQGRLIGDFDGDGRDDVVMFGGLLSDARIAISLGNRAIERDFAYPFPFAKDPGSPIVGDFNGDGLSDLARINRGISSLEMAINAPMPKSTDGFLLLLFSHLRFPLDQLIPLGVLIGIGTSTGYEKFGFHGLLPGLYTIAALGPAQNGAEPPIFSRSVAILPRSKETNSTVTIPIVEQTVTNRSIMAFDENQRNDEHRPQACIGYSPDHEDRNLARGKWDAVDIVCPPGYAYYSSSEGGSSSAACSNIFAQCCPLPARDILLEESHWTTEQCKDGFVATGIENATRPCEQKLRCSRVNYTRYDLLPPQPGVYWGFGLSTRGQGERLTPADIPEGIRFGVMRMNWNSTTADGCIGTPFGSLLTKKGGTKCFQSQYRQLVFRGAPGDPNRGTPVRMFPDCSLVDDIFTGDSGCFMK